MADVRISGETLEVPNLESAFSAMSWGAIFAGAIAAVATSLVLFTLGPGLGFASVSPYGDGASLAALGIAAGVWIIFVQWVSSALGGYLAGRLRAKWAVKESDEVFFRDTAHGLLAWGVATIIMASLFTHAGLGMLSAGAGAAQGAAQVAAASGADDYALDALFRRAAPTEAIAPAAAAPPAAGQTADREAIRAEAGRIFVRGLDGELDPADRTYLASLVATQSGLSQQEAEARVDETIASARQAADTARTAAASAAILLALALAIGAFVGTAAGGLGGRHRDEL